MDGLIMARDPQSVFNAWKANITSASTKSKMTDGVNAVTEAPGAAAAAESAKYLAGVQAKVDKWKTNVAAVPLDTWKTDMTSKGFANMSTGAAAASTQTKLVGFFTSFLPFAAAVKAWSKKIPATSLAEEIAKSGYIQAVLGQWTKGKPLSIQAAISAAQAAGLVPNNVPAP